MGSWGVVRWRGFGVSLPHFVDRELRDEAIGIYTYAGLEGVMASVAGAFSRYLVGVEGKIQVRGVIENSERYRHIAIRDIWPRYLRKKFRFTIHPYQVNHVLSHREVPAQTQREAAIEER